MIFVNRLVFFRDTPSLDFLIRLSYRWKITTLRKWLQETRLPLEVGSSLMVLSCIRGMLLAGEFETTAGMFFRSCSGTKKKHTKKRIYWMWFKIGPNNGCCSIILELSDPKGHLFKCVSQTLHPTTNHVDPTNGAMEGNPRTEDPDSMTLSWICSCCPVSAWETKKTRLTNDIL